MLITSRSSIDCVITKNLRKYLISYLEVTITTGFHYKRNMHGNTVCSKIPFGFSVGANYLEKVRNEVGFYWTVVILEYSSFPKELTGVSSSTHGISSRSHFFFPWIVRSRYIPKTCFLFETFSLPWLQNSSKEIHTLYLRIYSLK